MKTVLIVVVLSCYVLMLRTVVGKDEDERSVDRVSSKIYIDIPGALGCFRRMNGTHQIGCSSSINGDVGVVHIVNDTQEDSDVDWITSQGPHSPYIAVLYPFSFRSDVLNKFSLSGRVNGILLLHQNDSEVNEFSTDKSCPNRGYGLYKSPEKDNYCSNWNDVANTTDLLFRDWGFPIFYVSDELKDPKKRGGTIQSILDCFEKFNKPLEGGTAREWPLCAAQLQSFMTAAVDTPTCLRRSQISELSITQRNDCDPLGDRNLLVSLIPSNQADPYPESSDGSIIVIAARMDAASFFDRLTPGADSAGTGVTAVLAILKQLSSLKESLFNSPTLQIKNIYFILFNGEAFDYIGSSKVIYDMANDKFPTDLKDNNTVLPALLRMRDIKYFIELNQLALHSLGTYHIHRNWDASQTTGITNLIQALKLTGKTYGVNLAAPDKRPSSWMGVPPSSLQSFLANNSSFPGIVITNYENAFRNKHYNSIFDQLDVDNNLDDMEYEDIVDSISRLAATVACTVEQLVLGKEAKCESKQNSTAVGEILECYVKSGRCNLFQSVSSSDIVPHLREKPNFYVGVATTTYDLLSLTSITKNVMAYYQGDIVNNTNQTDCHSSDSKIQNIVYTYMNGNCYKTTILATPAISPAFEIKNYNWASGQYSSWTESVWSKLSVRIFLKPSLTHELITLLSGLAVFGISFILVGWISTKTDIIFPTRPEQIC